MSLVITTEKPATHRRCRAWGGRGGDGKKKVLLLWGISYTLLSKVTKNILI